MTIEFPCLLSDPSQWFSGNNNDNNKNGSNNKTPVNSQDVNNQDNVNRDGMELLVEALEKYLASGPSNKNLTSSTTSIQLPDTLEAAHHSSWLAERPDNSNKSQEDGDSDLSRWLLKDKKAAMNNSNTKIWRKPVNLMAPVMTASSNDKWLARTPETSATVSPSSSMASSMWLASTSSLDSLTCVTPSGVARSKIQWPTALLEQEHQVWLMQQQRQQEQDAAEQVWMAERKEEGDENQIWLMQQKLQQQREVMPSAAVESDLMRPWINKAEKTPLDAFLFQPNNNNGSANPSSSAAKVPRLDIWLPDNSSAIGEDDDEEMTNDDMSSIAIIDEEEDDFDLMEEEDNGSEEMSMWLLA